MHTVQKLRSDVVVGNQPRDLYESYPPARAV